MTLYQLNGIKCDKKNWLLENMAKHLFIMSPCFSLLEQRSFSFFHQAFRGILYDSFPIYRSIVCWNLPFPVFSKSIPLKKYLFVFLIKYPPYPSNNLYLDVERKIKLNFIFQCFHKSSENGNWSLVQNGIMGARFENKSFWTYRYRKTQKK